MMTPKLMSTDADPTALAVMIDASGVDRAQIRRLLELTPAARLREHDEFMSAMFRIWQQNGHQGFAGDTAANPR